MMRPRQLICKTIQTIRATFFKPAAILILLALQDAALKVCFVFLTLNRRHPPFLSSAPSRMESGLPR
jgi:hypothetical protein